MSTHTKKVIFWGSLGLLFLVGPGLNLMIEKAVPFNFVLDRMFKAPLPVHAYLLLLLVMTFVVGEIILYSFKEKDNTYLWLMCFMLGVGFVCTNYWYFLLLMVPGLCFGLVIVMQNKHPQVTQEPVNEEVSEEVEEETVEVFEENEEPEVSLEKEESLSDVQKKEIDDFLDSLFEKPQETVIETEVIVDEPLVQEILNDANDILEDANEVEDEVIKKEPPKEVVLEKKQADVPEDLLEAHMSEKEDSLGEFDEEIPMDDFVE